MLYHGTLLVGSAVTAAWLRRHLMVWKIFAPRFMNAAAGLVAVDVAVLIGVGLGVLTLTLIGDSLEAYFILDPSVGWGIIAAAFVSLIISGLVAGFVPAYRASKIKPIEALRTE